ncbi:Oxysterol-binding protein- protein 3 [Podila epigama]|nr:Oxysterol-binding protein- protein 3 [Podila epigama]
MQEIEVPPRDVFQHYVHVDKPGKTLVWWFSTKKKNISFGLYFRKSSSCPPQLKSNTLAPSLTTASPPPHHLQSRPESISSKKTTDRSHRSNSHSHAAPIPRPTLSSSPTKSSHLSAYASSSRGSSGSDDEGAPDSTDALGTHLKNPSQSSLPSTTQPSLRKKKTVAKLKDPDLIEILPIQHYDSSSGPVRGEYNVKEEGSYVLVFDNSFSINTSKRLTFFVALEERGSTPVAQPTAELSGWLLKKKRKRMQGWAKRWFQIDNGILSYSKFQNGPCRGKVHLVLSTVTVSQASNMIHIDSGTMLYHLKALNEDDYKLWTGTMKAFKAAGHRAIHDSVGRLSRRNSAQNRVHLRNSWVSSTNELDQLKELMSAMDAGFRDIKDQLDSIRAQSEGTASAPNSRSTSARERQPSAENGVASSASSCNGNNTSSGASTNSGNANKFKLPKFGIPALQRTTSDGSISSMLSLETIQARLQASFAKLSTDKEKAFELMRSEMERWEKNEKQYKRLLAESESLSAAAGASVNGVSQGLGSGGSSHRLVEKSSLSRHILEEAYIAHSRNSMNSDRTNSLTSSIHTGSDVFYDAMDDAVLTANMSSADLSDLEDAGFDDGGDDNSSDEDEEEEEAVAPPPETPAPVPVQKPEVVDEVVVRRKVLPAPVSGEDISLLSILRKNVGKDLSTVAMPVSLNEPINVLQKLCEELEYSELLDKAASMTDSLDRIVYIAAFAVSGYASSQWRAGRKPFNPLHGETFEYVCPERGFKYISEKVSHYPPVMACHAESVHGWTFDMDSRAKTKFWGKSMELMPNGTIHIYLTKTNDHFTIVKPTTWMRNLMAGTKYLEHTGELKVINHTTRETCVLTFKESSFFAGTKHEIVGHAMNSAGAKKRTLQGRWSESLMEEIAPNKLERLWQCKTPPPNHERYYGFTDFTTHLNEITKGLEKVLPKTDTRFRPDQSLFERGQVEEADREKLRIEQKQRDLRKTMESKGQPWEVRWFEKVSDPQTEDPEGKTWRYKGGYWEARETGEWNEKVHLW